MKIRPARETDYEELMELYNGFVEEDRYSQHTNDSFHEILRSSAAFIYVAEKNNTVIGFASFSIRPVVRYKKPIAKLEELYVKPDERKQGVGRELMKTILDKANQLQCHRMYISSHYDRKAAHAFYEALGFTNYGYHFIKKFS